MTQFKKPIAIDLFAGAGGLSEGLHLAGWDVAVAVEMDESACDTYELNHNQRQNRKTKVLRSEIEKIGLQELAKALMEVRGINPGGVDLVAGGPPCQGFSHIGPRSLDDPRNRLFLEFIRIIDLVRPKVFIAENVRGILSFAGRRMPGLLIKIFDKLGYNVAYDIINSLDFGVPQDRARVIFFGVRKDIAKSLSIKVLSIPAPYMPEPLRKFYRAGEKITVGEAISDLPFGVATAQEERIWVTNGDVYKGGQADYCFFYPEGSTTPYQNAMRSRSEVIFDNHTKGMSEGRLEKVKRIPEGGVMASPGRSNAWRRLSRERYSHTLQAHMGKDLKEFIHPVIDRWITIREAARLQSFDDAYRFSGSQSAQLRQIGNAVAPFVGWAIGRSIGEQIGLFNSQNFPLREPKYYQSECYPIQIDDLLDILAFSGGNTGEEKRTGEILHRLYDKMINLAYEEQNLRKKKVDIPADPGSSLNEQLCPVL